MYSIPHKFLFLVLLIKITTTNENEAICPAKCSCKRSTQKEGLNYIKMKCGDKEKVSHLDELELLNIAAEIVQLNVSDNLLKTFVPKVELTALQKLDLSRNQLVSLEENQFLETPNIRRLDISSNNIKQIHISAFSNLRHLERLKLNQNQISSITFGTFDPLINLKQLDISNNPLICDCGLLWMLDWSQRALVKLISNPKCSSPASFKGFAFRKLKIGEDIHCKSPATTSGLPIIDLKPGENQVVFEGDLLQLQCKAPSISDSPPATGRLQWLWLDTDPKLHFPDISIEDQHLPSTGIIGSTLTIPLLQHNHTGIWTCLLISMQGNHSKGITIVVINDDTKYCPLITTSNNKGTYNWPRTVINNTVTLTCESLNHNYDVKMQTASYTCTENGDWTNFNTTNCQYTSDTTKILQQYSKLNVTMLETSVLDSVRHFKNYISNRTLFKDVMDFVFTVNTIEIYSLLSNSLVNSILIDVVDNLIQLPKMYLLHADTIDDSLKKLRSATERLTLNNSSTQTLHKPNIAIEMFAMEKQTFNGMKCTWYVNPMDFSDKWFTCITNSEIEAGLHGKIIEASITIPASLFRQLDEKEIVDKANILIAMYSNSNLFPIDAQRNGKEDVTSCVIGAKLIQTTFIDNLTDPIFIMIRTPPSFAYEVTPFVPVWWNVEKNMWQTNGCQFSHELNDHVVFSCQHFGYYGLLQDISHLKSFQTGAKFKLSHPAIYVGSFILFISLFVCILTYLLCYKSIQMAKKAKHSLINMWISILMLCFMYVFGIYQTEDVQVCEIVGMILHYFTLCTLLWMCVGVNCMYKRLTKNNEIGLSDDNLPNDQPIQKPILGFYLVGWGIALIICGLSAAINIKEYSSPNHCFLRSGAALSALYIPFGILTAFLAIFFLLIRCAIYNLDTNGHLSEGTQATEHVDLDLLEPNFPNSSTRSLSTKTTTDDDEIEDPEHAPAAQLKAHIIYFLLYVMTWLSCAFATISPFHLIASEEDLFSISFAILSTTLSAFTLFFYCVARNDVRTKWMQWCRWMKRKHFRSRNVSDTTPQIPIQTNVNVPIEVPVVTSRTSSRASSNHTKSNSHNSNILKGAVDLNGSFSDNGARINNVNLIVLHRAQYRTNVIPNIIENPTNAAEVFYNPHQSIVARKFFKRQKRNMLKKNNLTQRPRDLNSDTASVFSDKTTTEMFGTNTKVNNTNIHVEHVSTTPQKNPNLLSDNTDDYNIRKKDTNRRKKHNNRKQTHKTVDEYNSSDNSQQDSPTKNNIIQTDDGNGKDVSDTSSIHYFYEEDYGTGTVRRRPKKSEEILQPSEDSCSGINESVARIYVNPQHDFLIERKNGTQSRGSSVSVSDLDELYQQIRRGPKMSYKNDRKTGTISCLSDSEVNSYVSDMKFVSNGDDTVGSSCSDDIETTV